MKNNNNLLEVPNINSKDAKLKKLIYDVDESLFNEDNYSYEKFEHLCVCSGGTTSSCAKNGFTTLDLRKNHSKIHLDRKTNLVTIGGGVIMGDLVNHLQKHNRSFPIGLSKLPGAGYILTGGVSPLSRAYGLAIDNIESIKGFLGNGTFISLKKNQINPEEQLIWEAIKGAANSSEVDIYKKIDLFGEVLEKINREYIDEINQSESMDSAINGLLQSLDPYSSYMSPEILEEMQTETSGEFGGLGIEVSMEAGVVKVISPIDDTPASKAGLKAGDYIVKINDTQVQGKSLSEAVDLMRGPVGSSIELTVRRRGEKKALTFNITREIIEIQSVKSELLEENIGYIRLTSFNENSSDQIEKQAITPNGIDADIFSVEKVNNYAGICIVTIRDGKIRGTKTHLVKDAFLETVNNLYELAVFNFYSSKANLPKKIFFMVIIIL